MIGQFIGIIIALIGAAFFAGSETAMIALLRRKTVGASIHPSILRWLDKPEDLLSATLVGTNICHIVASSLSASLFIGFFGTVGEFYSLVVMSIVILVFTEVLPKSRALSGPESFTRLIGRPFDIAGKVMGPLSTAAQKLSNVAVKITHKIVKPSPPPDWGEFELVTKEGKFKIGSSRHAMFLWVFEAAGKTVFDLMTPRLSLNAVFEIASPSQAIENMRQNDVTELPVESRTGEIIGVVKLEELILTDFEIIKDVVTEPFYVPEKAHILEIYTDMADSDIEFSLVVDEHGDITGGISFKKLSEFLLRLMAEEIPSSGEVQVIEGHFPINALAKLLGIEIPKGPYKTVGGFIEEQYHGIPPIGKGIEIGNWLLKIIDRTEKTIEKVKIERRD